MSEVAPHRMDGNQEVLRADRIFRAFPGVKALSDVSIGFRRGEVHCLVGQNGAGKSTFIKILAGALSPDSGDIWLEGRRVRFASPYDALRQGISVLYQELALSPNLTGAENIFLGQELQRLPGVIDFARAHREAARLVQPFGVEVPLNRPVGELSVAQKQIIALAKALSHKAKVVVFDEPSAVLTSEELRRLFGIIRSLQASGVAVVYISHRLEEIFAIGDRVTVLRNGQVVGTSPVAEIDQRTLVRMMIGRELEEQLPQRRVIAEGAPALQVKGLENRNLRGVDLAVARGEIVGLFGLVGAGRTELVRALFGLDPITAGSVEAEGHPLRVRSARAAIRHRLGLVPEDRKAAGIVPLMTVADNLTIPVWRRLANWLILSPRRVQDLATDYLRRLSIVTPSLHQKIQNLSGGNQQKVVLAKWLAADCRVLLLDEPTRGVDVGAKVEIKDQIIALAEKGLGILVISSELPELMTLVDRLLVMRNGRIVGEVAPERTTQEQVLALAMGVHVAEEGGLFG